MKLWRLDAMHEVEEGAFCLFFRYDMQAHDQANLLAKIGWMTDVYLDDLGDSLELRLVSVLTTRIWPLVSTQIVLRLLHESMIPAGVKR